jgi:hypothetical protein
MLLLSSLEVFVLREEAPDSEMLRINTHSAEKGGVVKTWMALEIGVLDLRDSRGHQGVPLLPAKIAFLQFCFVAGVDHAFTERSSRG